MYRTAARVFAVVALVLFGVGCVYAQTACPDISGTWNSTGKGVEWATMQGCGACTLTLCPAEDCPTFPRPVEVPNDTLRTASYIITQDFTDKCLFYAERFTQLQRYDCWNYEHNQNWNPCYAPSITVEEHGKWVGIIHDNGTAITMQARPGVINTTSPPDPINWPALATKLTGKITAIDKKTKKPTEIHVISTGSTDAASYWAVVSEATWTRAQPQ